MKKKKAALSVSQIFAFRLLDARKSRAWSQQDLADAMTRIGHPINRVGISKIEAAAKGAGGEVLGPRSEGKTKPRPVSIEEAVAFAVALDVPPESLYLPLFRDDLVQLAPNVLVDVDTAHEWSRGIRPLDPDNARFYSFQTYRTRQRPTLEQLEALGIRIETNEPKPRRRGRSQGEN